GGARGCFRGQVQHFVSGAAGVAGEIELPLKPTEHRQRLGRAWPEIPHEQPRSDIGEKQIARFVPFLPRRELMRERFRIAADIVRLAILEYETARALLDRLVAERRQLTLPRVR